MTGAITLAIEALAAVCREFEGDKIADEPRAALTALMQFKEGVPEKLKDDLELPVDSYYGEAKAAAKHLLEGIAE